MGLKRNIHRFKWWLYLMWLTFCTWWVKKTARFLSLLGFTVCQGVDGPCCRLGTRQRQNTSYCDDKLNWVTMCPRCAKYNDARWKEMWAEYWSGRL